MRVCSTLIALAAVAVCGASIDIPHVRFDVGSSDPPTTKRGRGRPKGTAKKAKAPPKRRQAHATEASGALSALTSVQETVEMSDVPGIPAGMREAPAVTTPRNGEMGLQQAMLMSELPPSETGMSKTPAAPIDDDAERERNERGKRGRDMDDYPEMDRDVAVKAETPLPAKTLEVSDERMPEKRQRKGIVQSAYECLGSACWWLYSTSVRTLNVVMSAMVWMSIARLIVVITVGQFGPAHYAAAVQLAVRVLQYALPRYKREIGAVGTAVSMYQMYAMAMSTLRLFKDLTGSEDVMAVLRATAAKINAAIVGNRTAVETAMDATSAGLEECSAESFTCGPHAVAETLGIDASFGPQPMPETWGKQLAVWSERAVVNEADAARAAHAYAMERQVVHVPDAPFPGIGNGIFGMRGVTVADVTRGLEDRSRALVAVGMGHEKAETLASLGYDAEGLLSPDTMLANRAIANYNQHAFTITRTDNELMADMIKGLAETPDQAAKIADVVVDPQAPSWVTPKNVIGAGLWTVFCFTAAGLLGIA